MTVACYTRISTPDQNPELQLRELRDYATRQGWELAEAYQDVGSGSNACRPGLHRLLEDAREGKFKAVLVWKLDRFGRSLVECLKNIQLLEDNKVRFIAVTQGLDTDQRNPASRFLLQVLGAAAEFERSLILERVQAGQARYRQGFVSAQTLPSWFKLRMGGRGCSITRLPRTDLNRRLHPHVSNQDRTRSKD